MGLTSTTLRRSGVVCFTGVAVLGLLLIVPVSSVATDYTFTTIAEGNDGSQNPGVVAVLGGGPTINAGGTVAFSGVLGSGDQGIFAGNGGALTTIAETSDGFVGFGGGPSINNRGVAAFRADFVGGEGTFTGSGGPLTTIADSSGALFSFGGVSINSRGTVAFFAGQGAGQGIFSGNGGPVTTIADTSTFPGGFSKTPYSNSSGTVAFQGNHSGADQGIFIGRGGPLTTIADTSGPLAVFPRDPAINAGGTVAFQATLDSGGQAIFTGSGGALTTVVDTDGPYEGFAGVSINNRRNVAFVAILSSIPAGIFTGADPDADKVIAIDDILFGSMVTSLGFSTQALNNRGQITFFAQTADGTIGIFRADPHP